MVKNQGFVEYGHLVQTVVSVIIRKKMKKKPRIGKKISCFVASFGRVWTFSPNFQFSICNLGFVQHIKAIILLKNGGQRNSQEENEKKI
jgi:hypothetical protein